MKNKDCTRITLAVLCAFTAFTALMIIQMPKTEAYSPAYGADQNQPHQACYWDTTNPTLADGTPTMRDLTYTGSQTIYPIWDWNTVERTLIRNHINYIYNSTNGIVIKISQTVGLRSYKDIQADTNSVDSLHCKLLYKRCLLSMFRPVNCYSNGRIYNNYLWN